MLASYIPTITEVIVAVIFLCATSYLTFFLYLIFRRRKITIISYLFLTIDLTILLFFLYGTFFEPYTIVSRKITIDLDDYNKEKAQRFIIISDFHLGRYHNKSNLERAVKSINSISDADTVLILGDTVNQTSKYLKELDILKKLKNKQVFFVFGNHDYYIPDNIITVPDKTASKVKGLDKKLKGLGVKVLNNQYEQIGNNTTLAGIEDIWSLRNNYNFIKKLDEDKTVILMCHNPDCAIDIADDPALKSRVDIIVSGHTHGGEMRLPMIGSISPLGIPIQLPQNYDKGLHEYEGIPIFITSGIGNVGVRMRTFNPPEVIILTIK